MRINLRDTKPMKRDLVYTTGELPTRPFDATRFLTPSPHQNRCRRPRVEKVGLGVSTPPSTAQDTAERRQVTVMFSDLVGSTALSGCMDPEDLREVISAYQKCVAETVL